MSIDSYSLQEIIERALHKHYWYLCGVNENGCQSSLEFSSSGVIDLISFQTWLARRFTLHIWQVTSNRQEKKEGKRKREIDNFQYGKYLRNLALPTRRLYTVYQCFVQSIWIHSGLLLSVVLLKLSRKYTVLFFRFYKFHLIWRLSDPRLL